MNTNEPDMVKRLTANAAHVRTLRDESSNTVDPWKAGHQCGSAVLADLCDDAAKDAAKDTPKDRPR